MGFEQTGLFDMEPLVPPKPARSQGKRWGGRAVMKLREQLGATLPANCWRCGRTVNPGDPWHVGHIQDRADGGQADARLVTLADVAVECAPCNLGAGGRRGAAVTNAGKVKAGPLGTFRERTIKWY